MNDTEALTEDERAMLHPCYSHLHEAVERIVAARVAAAHADALAPVEALIERWRRSDFQRTYIANCADELWDVIHEVHAEDQP